MGFGGLEVQVSSLGSRGEGLITTLERFEVFLPGSARLRGSVTGSAGLHGFHCGLKRISLL